MTLHQKAADLLETLWFRNFILSVIIFNAAILGLETWRDMPADIFNILVMLDKICLGIFVIELLLKLYVQRMGFFKQGWNIFDFIIVAFSLVPQTGALSALRSLRIMRAMRLFSAVPVMRRIVTALVHALPGVGAASMVMAVVFYISAVLTTKLFGASFPEWFGSLGASLYTLFQIMTLESWSMGIVRPVMDVYPYAWIFFVPFILISSFTVLNVFIGIIVDALAEVKHEETIKAGEMEPHEEVMAKLEKLELDLKKIMEKS